jgi:hypothetical protein
MSGTLFMEKTPGPLEHEKYCINVSRHARTGMHYVTHKSHRMQKHKFGITCLGMLFVESVHFPPERENSASMFHAPDAPE